MFHTINSTVEPPVRALRTTTCRSMQVFQSTYVGDDAHQPVALGQPCKYAHGLFQRFVIQTAEALVEEERVQTDAACRALYFVRKAQCQRQRGLEALTERVLTLRRVPL